MPTGWRPEDVKQSHPKTVITDVYQQQKYAPHYKRSLAYWAIFHFVSILGLMLLMLYHFGDLSPLHAVAIGMSLFAAIFGHTSVMDQHKWSVGFEWLRIATSFVVLQWALTTLSPILYWAWMGYLLISLLALIALLARNPMRIQTKS